MFRSIILPIFKNNGLCVTACGIMHPRCGRPIAWKHYATSCNTQSIAPEDGQNNCPNHVELTGIINKPLLLASSWLFILFIRLYVCVSIFPELNNPTPNKQSLFTQYIQLNILCYKRQMLFNTFKQNVKI